MFVLIIFEFCFCLCFVCLLRFVFAICLFCCYVLGFWVVSLDLLSDCEQNIVFNPVLVFWGVMLVDWLFSMLFLLALFGCVVCFPFIGVCVCYLFIFKTQD